jgi:diguanylate cyclase (GGDEF)-like protein/PAS domain S-box-containing protein
MVESKKSSHIADDSNLSTPGEGPTVEIELLREENSRLRARLVELEAFDGASANAELRAKQEALQEVIRITRADLERAETMSRTGSWSRDLFTNCSVWSPGKLKLFGLDPSGPTPDFESMLEMIHPDDRDQVTRTYALSIASGERSRMVYRVQTPKGDRALESLLQPILEEHRVVGTVQDVTEDIAAAIELVQNEARLRAIVDNLSEGLLLKDPNGVILLANPASELLLECPAGKMVGSTTHDPRWKLIRFDGSPMPAEEHPADRVINSRTSHRGIVMGLELANGNIRWLHCSGIPLFDENGTDLTGILCTFVDFTDNVIAENSLAEINALRGAILSSTDFSIISTDTSGKILSFNEAAEQMFGYEQSELVGRASMTIIHCPEEVARRAAELGMEHGVQSLFHLAKNGRVEEREWTLVRKDGSRFPAMLTVTAMRTEEKRLLGFLGVARDISLSKAHEEELRASEARLSDAQRLAKFGSWETDIVTGATTWSAGLFELLAIDSESGSPSADEFLACVHHEDRQMFKEAFESAEHLGQSFDLEFRYLRSGTEVITLHSSAQVYRTDDRPVRMLGNVQDVTERKAAQRQIEWQMRTISSYAAELEAGKRELEKANARLEALATTDGLTGIMNHRAFQEKADQEFKRARRYETPMSLLLIDVDKFKSYNDSFGHQAGDEVLRAVARTLIDTGRETDWIARYGGEEFVVILPETGLDQALDAAERFRVAVNSRALGSRELSISVGVSTMSANHLKPADLVADSDRALYFAKFNGRNRVAWVDPASSNPMVGP